MSSRRKSKPPPPPLQNCLICSEIVDEDLENSEKKRKVCQIFCRVACRYLNIQIGNFNPPERTLTVHSDSAINEDNCGLLCGNCFPLAESFCKIYNKFQYLEQLFQFRIKESINRIQVQMEKGVDDHDHDDDESKMENRQLNQEKRSRSQIDFRQKFLMRGKQKLSENVPIVYLDRQGLDLDSETAQTKIAINFLEGSSEAPAEEDVLPDPLDINTEQELDDDEEESRHSDISYWCVICDTEFTRISEYQRHRQSCCGSESVERKTKVKRVRNSKDSKEHCCKFCGKSFRYFSKLRIHENIHTGAESYKCRFCERTFAFFGNRDKHELVHTGAMPFECAICGQRFRQNKSLKLHGGSNHPWEGYWSRSTSDSYFKCDFCFKVFTTLEQKFTHERSHSSTSSSRKDPVATGTRTTTLATEKKKIPGKKKLSDKKQDFKAKEMIAHAWEICGKSNDHKSVEEPADEGDATEEGDIPLVKVENSNSAEWDDEVMEADLDTALTIY